MPNIQRRDVLIATCCGAVTALSGCISDSIGVGSNQQCERPSTEDMENNEPGDGYPQISVSPDEPSVDHIHLSTSVIRHFDDEGPARIRITLMNDGDKRREFYFGDIQPFYGLEGNHIERDELLYLNPEEGAELPVSDEPIEGCWQLRNMDFGFVDVTTSTELDPCEQISMEYDLYSGVSDECLPAGEYRFDYPDVGELAHEWGLSLHLGYE